MSNMFNESNGSFYLPSSTSLGSYQISASHTIKIVNPNGKEFCLDFNGDMLKSSGDLVPDEAAEIFFNEIGKQLSKKITELENQLAANK